MKGTEMKRRLAHPILFAIVVALGLAVLTSSKTISANNSPCYMSSLDADMHCWGGEFHQCIYCNCDFDPNLCQ